MQCLCDLPRGWLIGRKEPWKLAVKSWNKNHIPSENVDIFEQYGWFSALHDSYLSRKQVRSLEKHDKCRWQDKMFNILLWTRKVLCGSLLTRKVLCGSLLCAIYKFSFVHSVSHTVLSAVVTLTLGHRVIRKTKLQCLIMCDLCGVVTYMNMIIYISECFVDFVIFIREITDMFPDLKNETKTFFFFSLTV